MIEIGRSKRAQPVYSFDDIAIVPTRRTRHIEDVRLNWSIDALTFDFPIVAAPQDSVMSPATAAAFGRLGGLGVLNLEGLWTRYDDPEPLLAELSEIEDQVSATRRMQEIYSAPATTYVAGFLGAANIFEAEVVECAGGSAQCRAMSTRLQAAVDGPCPTGPAAIVIRPERITLQRTDDPVSTGHNGMPRMVK